MRILNSPDMGGQTFEAMVNNEMSTTFATIIKEHGKRSFSPNIPFARCVANVTFTLLFGHRPTFDQEKRDWYIHAIPKLREFGSFPYLYKFQATVKKAITAIFPKTNLASNTSPSAMEILWSLSNDGIAGYKALAEKMSLSNFTGKFISLAEEKSGKGEKTYVSEVALPGVIANLLLGGLETTSMIMSWMCLLLAKHQDVQTKLRNEVYGIISNGEHYATLRDRDSMPYTLAVLQETFRFVTPGPLGAPHRAGKDDKYKGYFVPKGTWLVSNIWAVHNNEELFPEPHKFKPERFINQQGEFVRSKQVIPFSVGPRSCPGEVLAQKELFLFLVNLVQRFEIRPPEGRDLPNLPEDSFFNGTATYPPPFEICFVPIGESETQ